jgi:hypothetical protein
MLLEFSSCELASAERPTEVLECAPYRAFREGAITMPPTKGLFYATVASRAASRPEGRLTAITTKGNEM